MAGPVNPPILAIDVGSSGIRSALVAPGETPEVLLSTPLQILRHENQIELGPYSLLRDFHRHLKRCPPEASAIAIASQRSTLCAWRPDGKLLAPIISWQDRRAAAFPVAAYAQPERIRQLSGLPPLPHFSASKMRWLLEHNAQIRAAARDGSLLWGPLPSWLLYRCGVDKPFVCDTSLAQRTQLLDIDSARWSVELMQLFGIPAAGGGQLPQILKNGMTFCELETGRGPLPVRALAGDKSAGLWQLGPDSNKLLIELGTCASISTGPWPERSKASVLDAARQDTRLDTSNGTFWIQEHTLPECGSLLRWHGLQSGKATDYDHLDPDDAARLPCTLHFEAVEGEPGFTCDCPPDIQALLVLEHIAFSIYQLIADNHVAGQCPRVYLAGGLPGRHCVGQWLADLMQKPIALVAGNFATLTGIATLAGLAPPPLCVRETFLPGPTDRTRQRYTERSRNLQSIPDKTQC
ncbi:FGGY-family carbohydrate kinase [Biformimicrobium ophioploci]|uniref:FGGY-family carbohydrate kinase n=2 Tax=Biformimicrobium ophioploci TaxID=3036711 RepID=A0ABQ6LYZ8_9GAMM|nr:FGGY-family carbohydrate kinase [Microbulbifer sp. NKW57]